MASEGPTDRRGCRRRAAVSRRALGDALRRYRWRSRSALHVCELLADLAIADLEQVDAADVPTVPAVRPTLDDAVAEGERLFDLEATGRVVEDRLPRLAALVAALVLRSVRLGAGRFEQAVVGDHRQHRLEVVGAPCGAERGDDGCCIGCF